MAFLATFSRFLMIFVKTIFFHVASLQTNYFTYNSCIDIWEADLMRQTEIFGMTRTINVVDAICGAGKTSWAIQYINESNKRMKQLAFGEEHEKFIYVTPFLNEVECVKDSTNIGFVDPEVINGKGSKMKHFRALINAGQSIVTTHALFKKLDLDTLEMIEDAGYTLIMDEVANVMEQYNIDDDDFKVLIRDGMVKVEDDGTVVWLDDDYNGSRFYDIRILAESENLTYIDGIALYWTMNTRAFEAFETVFVLTYMFDGQQQCGYYKANDIKFKKFSVDNQQGRYELVDYNPKVEPRKKLYELLNVYEDYQKGKSVSAMNSNFDSREKLTSQQKQALLSSGWFDKASDEELKQLKNNLNNYFRNQVPTDNDNLYWTTKKSTASTLKNPKCKLNKKDDRSKDNFLPFNARATNDYANCTAMAFVYNRFMNPMEKRFFKNYGVEIDENALAVSDLIQFLFRGCIRKGEPMNCYIPSERMRSLLKAWADYKI